MHSAGQKTCGKRSLSGTALDSINSPHSHKDFLEQRRLRPWTGPFCTIYILILSRSPPLEFSWQGTWRSTLLQLDASHVSPIKCTDLFSDALYRPFQCAHIPLLSFTDHMPVANQMPRLSDLSPQEFYKSWTDKPFILTEPARKWPVYVDWSTDVLLAKYGNIAFRAEAVDWPLKTYVNYMNNNSDESPLYLFDKDFVGKMNLEVGGRYYWPPECFGDDLFALLGDQRPDSRWLIIGPERSGSTFHKDPNATSAWNAVLRGSKYWIMFPTHPGMPPPPGVFVSEDQSEVTSPLSIAEWLLTFHTEARRTRGCMEGICCEGEILHVPSGWWHLVVNLTSAIAITQNFIPRTHLGAALDFLENKPDQITGFKKEVESPHRLFVDKLREHEPALLEEALRERTPAVGDKKRKWDDLVHDDKIESIDAGGFNFGFSSDGENDDLD